MYRYSCLSFCSKNKARIWANNRNRWLSEGKPQGSISCRHSGICFHFPRCLCGPICYFDWSCLHCVRAVIESWVWAWTVLLQSFPVLPPPFPEGAPWSLSHSYVAQESSEVKTWQTDPQSPLLFLPNSKNMCSLWVHLWKENRPFPVLQRAESYDTLI